MFVAGPRGVSTISSSHNFTDDFKETPYWWDEVPRPKLAPRELPATAETVVIGSGYTGLCAALTTARAGRHTVVVDAESAGWGCSTRNGGQVAEGIKLGSEELIAKHGAEKAAAIEKEGDQALRWIGEFVAAEAIDCDYKVCGRFHAAHTRKAYEDLQRRTPSSAADGEGGAYLVPRDRVREELGTDAYHGGLVIPQHASLDPARYHQGLLQRTLEAGVELVPDTAVTKITRQGSGFEISSERGSTQADSVILATNGYTGTITPWQRRRVIPIGSYIIATEEIGLDVMDRLMPRDRMVSDTRKVVYYYRASPDRKRILFGGRVSHDETDPRRSAPRLHADMVKLFPELAETRISHSWLGFVAYTFDNLPHVGMQGGIHYAMGYCGTGVAMASYLGMRAAQKLLGHEDAATAFDDLSFETRPFYTGNPWFLAATVRFYRWRDNRV